MVVERGRKALPPPGEPFSPPDYSISFALNANYRDGCMLQEIKAEGFKGFTFHLKLSGLDLIASKGGNGAVQSAVFEALSLCLLGTMPARPRLECDVVRFAHSNEVRLETGWELNGNRFQVQRTYRSETERGDRQHIRINGIRRSREESRRWIQCNLGEVIPVLPVDPSGFPVKNKPDWFFPYTLPEECLPKQVVREKILVWTFKRFYGEKRSYRALNDPVPVFPALRMAHEGPPVCRTGIVRQRMFESDPEFAGSVTQIVDEALSFWSESISSLENMERIQRRLGKSIESLNSAVHRRSAARAYLKEIGLADRAPALKDEWKQFELKRRITRAVADSLGLKGISGEIQSSFISAMEEETGNALCSTASDLRFMIETRGARMHFGLCRHGRFHPLDTLGPASRLLCAAALTAALLCRLSRLRTRRGMPAFRLLRLSTETLPRASLMRLLKMVSQLKQNGWIDQALITNSTCMSDTDSLYGFRLHGIRTISGDACAPASSISRARFKEDVRCGS